MLSRRRLAIAIAAVAASGTSALAFRAPSVPTQVSAANEADAVALPAAKLAEPLRTQPDFLWQGVPGSRVAAWNRLRAAAPGLSDVSWDIATEVPSRIWGRGIDVPGSIANPDIAAAAARRFLADHIDLL